MTALNPDFDARQRENVLASEMVDFPDEGDILEPSHRSQRATAREAKNITLRVVDDVYARGIGRVVVNEIKSTLVSLRGSPRPRTVLHALIYRDGQSIEEIQARLESDTPVDLEATLAGLKSVGIVSQSDVDGVIRYAVIPPDLPVDAEVRIS